MSDWAQKKCQPCHGGTAALTQAQADGYLKEVAGWQMSPEGKQIERTYVCKDFRDALRFANQIGEIAESEDHHPNLCIFAYKRLRIELSTHAIGGLSENDFILAGKINQIRNL